LLQSAMYAAEATRPCVAMLRHPSFRADENHSEMTTKRCSWVHLESRYTLQQYQIVPLPFVSAAKSAIAFPPASFHAAAIQITSIAEQSAAWASYTLHTAQTLQQEYSWRVDWSDVKRVTYFFGSVTVDLPLVLFAATQKIRHKFCTW